MHAVGTPESVAKFVGLITRVILEEPEDASNSHSKPYTLLVLIPHAMMGRLIGSRMAHFKEIERQSAAHLSADHNKLPNSDDRLVYIAGVADSLHIAVYHLGVAYLRDPQRKLHLLRLNRHLVWKSISVTHSLPENELSQSAPQWAI